ncbi:unnamed protein product, partial [Medioppia subpectinata]
TMASEGRTIVCTIHQPSSQVFALFDHILLMADGRVAFMGTTETAKHFFSSLGYGSTITSNNYEENRIKQICDKYLISNFCQQISGNNNAIECQTRHTLNDSFSDDNNNSANRWSGYKYGFWAQLRALLWRSYLLTIRNQEIIIAQMIFML